MKALLASQAYVVCPSSTHDANNCLIDSIILSLQWQGKALWMTLPQRAALSSEARAHLIDHYGVQDMEYLAHEDHFAPICDFLRSLGEAFWESSVVPEALDITAVVFDRLHRCLLLDVAGGAAEELPDSPGASSSSPLHGEPGVEEVVLLLYCNIDTYGTPYHYEWIGSGDGLAAMRASAEGVQPPPAAPSPRASNSQGAARRSGRLFCQSFGGASSCSHQNLPPCPPAPRDDGTPDDKSESESDVEDIDDSFLHVGALPDESRPFLSEQDAAQQAAQHLSQCLRRRPTLPPDPKDLNAPWTDVNSAMRLPLLTCSFRGCAWWGERREELERHLKANDRHREDFLKCRSVSPFTRIYADIDLYEEAIAILEREQFPLIGPSVDRRALETLTRDYKDDSVRSLICFVCGQIHTQMPGPNSEIEYQDKKWFGKLGQETLEVNLGWDSWFVRYGGEAPLLRYGPGQSEENPKNEWCCKLCLPPKFVTLELFGCPEDWQCEQRPPRKASDGARKQFLVEHGQGSSTDVATLCTSCSLPVCRSCRISLATAKGRFNVPMALSNDNWYGYVQDIIARHDARWIECACASLCWTTLVTYHLEEPYGHLMNESMQGPLARTGARGNVFSFMMPWGDILENLQRAESSGTRVPLPHNGAVLAVLVRVSIIGGSLDVTKHLRDVHVRVGVVRRMLEELIDRGFPGYEHYDKGDVRDRTRELYGEDSRAKLQRAPRSWAHRSARPSKALGALRNDFCRKPRFLAAFLFCPRGVAEGLPLGWALRKNPDSHILSPRCVPSISSSFSSCSPLR